MQLRIDEALHSAGRIETTLDEGEAEFVVLSMTARRTGITLTPGGDHPETHYLANSLSPTAAANAAAEMGFDTDGAYLPERDTILRPLYEGVEGEDGEVTATWTNIQVFNVIGAIHSATHMVEEMRNSPTPGVPSPVLGTVLAVIGSKSPEEADGHIAAYLAAVPFVPPEVDPSQATTPGKRAECGFAAARAALWYENSYDQATAIVATFNQAVAAAVAA